MAEVVGLTAGLVSLENIVQNATAIVVQFKTAAKPCPIEVTNLLLELTTLVTYLRTVRALQEQQQGDSEWSKLFTKFNLFNEWAVSVLDALNRIIDGVRPAGFRDSGRLKAFKWPFTRQETIDLTARIAGAKNVLRDVILHDTIEVGATAENATGNDESHWFAEDISQELHKISSDRKREELHEIYRWLAARPFESRLSDLRHRREHGTCTWFLDSPEFQAWLDAQSSTLWCPGVPGSGKTILASFVIDYLYQTFEDQNIGVAYAFCTYNDLDLQSQTPFLASFVAQLLASYFQRYGDLPEGLSSWFRKHSFASSRPSHVELSQILQEIVRSTSRVFIVIDALDELSDVHDYRTSLIETLHAIRRATGNLSLLITSRFIAGIDTVLKADATLEIRASANDLSQYIHNNVGRLRVSGKFDAELKNTITETLIRNANGMFLFATLQLHSLKDVLSLKQLRQRLTKLPRTLSEAYSQIIDKIDSSGRDTQIIAYKVLGWMCVAQRPLTTRELQFALALDPDDEVFDYGGIIDETSILDICQGLVVVHAGSDTVRLVHFTAQEFLTQEQFRGKHPISPNNSISLSCLSVLLLRDVRSRPCRNDQEFLDRLEKYPFLQYAAQFLAYHARSALSEPYSLQGHLLERICALLEDQSARESLIQLMHAPDVRFPNFSQSYPSTVESIHLAAYFGLETITVKLLEQQRLIELENDWYGRPLQAAALGGFFNVVRILLEFGASVDGEGGRYHTALQAAAALGKRDIVDLLLRARASTILMGGVYTTALHAASLGGNQLIVTDLLDCGAEVNAYLKGGKTALHCAAINGHAELTEILVDHGALLDARDGDHGRTALSWAAWNGHADVVNKLLAKGADVNAVDHQKSTPLHLALERRQESVVELLLDAGAKWDLVDASNKTQIQLALQSIEKIDPNEFERDEVLTSLLKLQDKSSQADDVSVYRRVSNQGNSRGVYNLIVRKAFQLQGEDSEELKSNLIREREALRNVNHPNVVRYLKYEEDEEHETAFLFTEYCDGGSLSQYTKRRNPRLMSRFDAWSILRDLAAALAYCHHGLEKDESGAYFLKYSWIPLLHRDIKPANVVLCKSNNGPPLAKLCDLGWTKVWADPGGYYTRQVGSIRYMPTEVKNGGRWTPKGDIYSLGATMRELKKDFNDSTFDELLSSCVKSESERPSSFTLLEISTKKVAEMLNITAATFLSAQIDLSYLAQAVLDTVDRFFRTYFHVRKCRLDEGHLRLRHLINDYQGSPEAFLKELRLGECPYLALAVCERQKVVSLLGSGQTECKGSWNTFGMTPLHIASREGYLDVATAWLANVSEAAIADVNGRTPLHWSCMNGHANICNLLLQEAPVEVVLSQYDAQGCTPLHRAAEIGHVPILNMLLHKHADVTAKDREGSTPLHMAAANGHFDAVKILVKHDSVLSEVDKEGFTPEESAMKAGYTSIGDYIRLQSSQNTGRVATN